MSVTANQELCKQPSEKRKFAMEFANLLSDNEEVSSINSITHEKIDGSTSDLSLSLQTITDGSATNSRVTVWIEGGTAITLYRIEVIVTTTNGQILEGDGLLKVTDR